MSQERIQPHPYLKRLLQASVLGLIDALISFIFMVLVHEGQVLIWEQTAQAVSVSAPVFIGLLVGVILSSTDIGVGRLGAVAQRHLRRAGRAQAVSTQLDRLLQPFGSLYFAGAHALESHLPDPDGA